MPNYSRLNVRGLNTLQKTIDDKAKKALWRLGQSIAREARNRAPKDTGALSESIYVVSQDKSDYQDSQDTAVSLFEASKMVGYTPKGRPIGKKATWEPVAEVLPENPMEVRVEVGAEYGIYVEMGTAHMAAQPFLLPAVLAQQDKVAPFFKESINEPVIGSDGFAATVNLKGDDSAS